MEGTIFQYSALKEYTAAVREAVNPISYFERYQQTPQIEVLVKLGLIGVVKELIRYRYGIVTDQDARRPDKFLGIRKESVKQLIAAEGQSWNFEYDADGKTHAAGLDRRADRAPDRNRIGKGTD